MIHGQTEVREAYRDELVAREYVDRRFRSPIGALLHARQTQVLTRLLQENRFERTLEIAPGPARLTVDLAPALSRLTLVDASAQMLQEARRRLHEANARVRPRLVQADAFQLPFKAPFDLVYSFRLIRHFERPDRLRLYRQIAAVLRPGGFLVFDAVNELVSAPFRAKSPGEHQHYDALLRPAQIREELAEVGFDLRSLDGVQRRYDWLYKLQVYVAPRSTALARAAMEILDRSGGEPLEWIVTATRA